MDYTFKVANMRKAQEFTLYPYSGGDYIILQSDHRIARVNLRTGKGIINSKNKNYSIMADLAIDPMEMELPEDIKVAIQKKLWENNGKTERLHGVLIIENKPLFSQG